MLALYCVLSVGLMACQDTVGSALMISEARTLYRWPGVFDALGDLFGRFGTVISSVVAVHYGLWSWQLDVVLLVTMATSLSTTNTVVPLAGKMLPRANAPWPVLLWMRALWKRRDGQ